MPEDSVTNSDSTLDSGIGQRHAGPELTFSTGDEPAPCQEAGNALNGSDGSPRGEPDTAEPDAPQNPTFSPKNQADWARIGRARRVDGVVVDFEDPERWFDACPRIRAHDGPQMQSVMRHAHRTAISAHNSTLSDDEAAAALISQCHYEHQRTSNVAIAVASLMGGGLGETTYLAEDDLEVTFKWGGSAEDVRSHARRLFEEFPEGPDNPGPLENILAAGRALSKPKLVTDESVWDFLSRPGSACGVRSALASVAGNDPTTSLDLLITEARKKMAAIETAGSFTTGRPSPPRRSN